MAASSFSLSLTGNRLSDYGSEVRTLGEGAFGRVYITEKKKKGGDKSTSKVYAIKSMKARTTDGTTFHDILSEVAFPLHLEHPNIVGIIDVILEGLTQSFIVMPMADMDLGRLIDEGYFNIDPWYIKNAAAQLISAVAYLTAHDILHRDIKPHNILCYADTDGYRYKLADFGLARPSSCQRVNNEMGAYTRWYRPPELFEGVNPYTEKADVWALGCTLYELLGHGHAFYKKDIDEQNIVPEMLSIIRRTMGTEKPYRYLDWDGAEPSFEHLVRSMLVIDPELRSDIFTVQFHNYLSMGNRVVAPYTLKVSCAQRATDYPLNLDIDLLDYSPYVINATLRWMTSVSYTISGLNPDIYGMNDSCERDTDRADWLARSLFLSYISQVKVITPNLQLVATACLYTAMNFFIPCGEFIDISDIYVLIAGAYRIEDLRRTCCHVPIVTEFDMIGSTPPDVLRTSVEYSKLSPKERQLASLLLFLAGQDVKYATHPDLVLLCVLEADGRLSGQDHRELRASVIDVQNETEVKLQPSTIWDGYLGRL